MGVVATSSFPYLHKRRLESVRQSFLYDTLKLKKIFSRTSVKNHSYLASFLITLFDDPHHVSLVLPTTDLMHTLFLTIRHLNDIDLLTQFYSLPYLFFPAEQHLFLSFTLARMNGQHSSSGKTMTFRADF